RSNTNMSVSANGGTLPLNWWLTVPVESSSSVPPFALTLMLVLLRTKAPSTWVVPAASVKAPPEEVGAIVKPLRTRMVMDELEGVRFFAQVPLMVSDLTSTLALMLMLLVQLPMTTSSDGPGTVAGLQLPFVF